MVIGGMLGILDSLTGGEVILVLVVALLVLGPERLPEAARTMGQWAAKLKAMTGNLQSEVREVLDDPAMKPIRDVGEFVAAPRKKLMEFATEAEREAEEAKREAAEAQAEADAAERAAAVARAKADAAADHAEEAEEVAEAAEHALAEASEGTSRSESSTPEVSIWADLDAEESFRAASRTAADRS